MALHESERMRLLVSDYYHGLTTPELYRQQRGQLLDNIGVEIVEPSETIAPVQRSPAKEPPSSAPIDAKTADSSPGSKWLLVSALLIAGIAVAGYVILNQMTDFGITLDSAADESSAAAKDGGERGDALIDDFLSRNNWTDESLNNFQLAWEALDDEQRQLVADGRRFRRLASSLHRRIREETALGDAASGGQLRTLTNFAAAMGVPYRESPTYAADRKSQTERVANVTAEEQQEALATESDDTEAIAVVSAESLPDATEVAAIEADQTDEPVDEGATEPDTAITAEAKLAAPVNDPCPAAIANTRRPFCQDKLSDGSLAPPLVVLPTGSYQMGSDGIESESPSHQVDIAYHIAMSRYEVTAAEYEQFCAATSLPCPEQRWNVDAPVVSVNWDDANSYTEWLSEMTGFHYRLPSEAEWEFAARAGTQSPYYFGDEITPTAAHSSDNGGTDAPLPRTDRQINRNPFRLYHMSGNVREWIQDSWHPNYDNAPSDGSARLLQAEDQRVVRGGSYADVGTKLRSAAREPIERAHRDDMTGFRIVRDISQ